jgi:hypothetical protein
MPVCLTHTRKERVKARRDKGDKENALWNHHPSHNRTDILQRCTVNAFLLASIQSDKKSLTENCLKLLLYFLTLSVPYATHLVQKWPSLFLFGCLQAD